MNIPLASIVPSRQLGNLCGRPRHIGEDGKKVGDRPATGLMDKTVLYSVDDHYTVQPITPSLSAPGSDRREAVLSTVDTTVPLPVQ